MYRSSCAAANKPLHATMKIVLYHHRRGFECLLFYQPKIKIKLSHSSRKKSFHQSRYDSADANQKRMANFVTVQSAPFHSDESDIGHSAQ
jgi:hypothetical protein